MNKNTSKNMGIVAASAFGIQLIFKLMGSSNKSVIIQATIIVVLCIIFAVYMYNATKKKLGNKLSIVGVILLLAAAITFSAGYIVMECYPELYRGYKTIDKYLELGTFAALIVFFLVAGVIVSYKENK